MGYSSNISKTAAYSPDPTPELQLLCENHRVQLQCHGIIVLKTPIGTDEYCKNHLDDVQVLLETAVEQLSKIKPHNAIRLLRFCFIPRLQYLARTVPPRVFEPHAQRFDNLVRSTFLQIAGIRDEEMTPRADTLLKARFCQGGLAFRSLLLISPLAYFSSLVASHDGIVRNNPHFTLDLASSNPSPASRLVLEAHRRVSMAFNNFQDLPSSVADLLKDVFPSDPKQALAFYTNLKRDNESSLPFKLQRSSTQCMEKYAFDPIIYEGSDRELALLNSTATSEASLWLHALPSNPRDRLSDDELRTGYRLRLGIACAPSHPTSCAACQRDFDTFGDHALTCKKTARWATTHNTIRDAITRFLKRNDIFVQTEFTVARRNSTTRRHDNGSLINADHLVLIKDQALWFDNATVVPTGASYRAAAARSRRAALNQQAREKHLTYDSHAAAQGARFFALINESGGAISSEWHQMLQTLLKLTDETKHSLLQASYRDLIASVSSLTAKGNARSVAHSLFTNTRRRVEQQCAELRAH